MASSARPLPPLDLLRGFEAAARHLSFTRAAAELFLTQSAVSRQIQALESFVGVPLFERRHKALVLTDAGQAYYRAVTAAPARSRRTRRMSPPKVVIRCRTVETRAPHAQSHRAPSATSDVPRSPSAEATVGPGEPDRREGYSRPG